MESLLDEKREMPGVTLMILNIHHQPTAHRLIEGHLEGCYTGFCFNDVTFYNTNMSLIQPNTSQLNIAFVTTDLLLSPCSTDAVKNMLTIPPSLSCCRNTISRRRR